MTHSFRLSRITAPRATFWSVILLIVACAAFGVSANAGDPQAAALGQHAVTAESAHTQLLDLAATR